CVPNFSEGRDSKKIEDITAAASGVPGVIVLDVEKDPDHNRTVLSFVAPLNTAVEACFRVAKRSMELIDLNFHKGEHPRMGALDVAPFIPVADSSVEECVTLARQLAERIGGELQIPVYLYDLAAQKPERKDLAKVRKGQFESLKEEIGKNPDRIPDFGPNKIHPTAGAIAVGARHQIVNFNVNLDTKDMEFGKALATRIRTSGGGLPFLRAKEIFLETKGQVQISTVLTNYKVTSLKTVMDAIEKETGPRSIKIADTELIGLTTQEALVGYAADCLKVSGFNPRTQILENRLAEAMSTWQAGANSLVNALSDTNPTPGGGSAGAVAGAMGCALGMMALGLSVASKKFEESKKPALRKALEKLKVFKSELQNCISEDSRAYDLFMKARKIPKEESSRPRKMQEAIIYAAQVPLSTAHLSARALEALESCGEIYPAVNSDYKSAGYLLRAAIQCAAENVRINLESINDKKQAAEMEKEINGLTVVLK
ncbi:MAG: glutamate formimidoyltransferase, partial [bacterium]